MVDEATNRLEISYDAALDAVLSGDHGRAAWIIRRLLDRNEAPSYLLSHHPAIDVRLDHAAANGDGERHREVFSRGSILGRAGETLEPLQRRLIEAVLAAHWDAWESDARALPPMASAFAAADRIGADEMSAIKLALVIGQFMHASPDYSESDAYHNFYASALAAGLKTVRFASDRISSDPALNPNTAPHTRPIGEELAELTAFLEAERPQIVLFDANFEISPNTIDPAYWREQKERFGFKLIALISDSYDFRLPNGDVSQRVRTWSDCVDMILTFHPLAFQLIDQPKVVFAPSYPLVEASFRQSALRETGLISVAKSHRDRTAWISTLAAAEVPLFALHHDHRRGVAPERELYLAMLGQSRMIFNNGYVSPTVNIMTGRFFEGLLSGCLVLQEDGSPIDRFFARFIHFVPLANINELICYARFFDENEPWRARITGAALDFWRAHYDGTRLWRYLCVKLLLDGEVRAQPPARHFNLDSEVIATAFRSARAGILSAQMIGHAADQFAAAGELALAVDLYRTWLAHTESRAAHGVWHNLGVLLARLGDGKSAREAFHRALAIAPNFEPARIALNLPSER